MQPLTIQDRVMVSLHQSLRRRGYAGLLLHAYVYLGGRLDEAVLRAALDRLTHQHPVAGARLVRPWFRAPRWEWNDQPSCPLTVSDLGSEDAEPLRYAERLFATPLELGSSPPVHFHLLRRPCGRDVVLLQVAHALMDGKAVELLLQEVNRLHADPAAPGTVTPSGDPLCKHMSAQPSLRRLRGMLTVVRDLPCLGLPAQLLGPRGDGEARPRIALRRLDADQSAACLARVRRLCGFSNVMPVLLAAAYRAVARVAPRPPGRWGVCYTHSPINQRPPGPGQAIFQNLQTYVRLQARTSQLADRDELARLLQRQFRDQLRDGFDLGFLHGIWVISGASLATGLLLRGLSTCLTFVFGYHGSVAPGLETFCGVPVESLATGLPNAWTPPGLCFAAHQFQGRLVLMASHIPATVPAAVVDRFLDAVVEELLPA